ncbi:heterokaryon incompatibility protein-domain-containing protein [Penicillium angulare]|uniref:Heterokaryon incompatibility protein-domain-containing protein n=1 Tax=Penicillium angulare TaxID=116970 RepID=A0A9W9KK77_9EURO|nr:heterokaryon incompatibility protein-domain-containing protein [Penicillium angulare]
MSYERVTTVNEYDTFRSLSTSSSTIIQFHAKLCDPSASIAPQFGALSQQNDHICCMKIDVEEMPDLAANFGIRVTPTFVVLENGTERTDQRVAGADPRALQTIFQIPTNSIYRDLENPLEWIRLLRSDGPPDGTGFTLAHYSIRALPFIRYKALSYRCGKRIPTDSTIRVNNRDMQISEKLSEALTNLFQLGIFAGSPLIWIDEICINEDNEQEVNDQVKIMYEIYTLADRVEIWLGLDENNLASLAMTSLEIIAVFARERRSAYPALETDQTISHAAEFLHEIQNPRTRISLEAILDLVKKDWWGHVWVIQESLLAKKARLICGSVTTEWNLVFDALWFLSLVAEFYPQGEPDFIRSKISIIVDRVRHYTEIKKHMFDGRLSAADARAIPALTAHLEATKEVDRFYGILSFVHWGRDSIIVDYKKSFEEVKADFYRMTAIASDT